MAFTIQKYQETDVKLWNEFVAQSKNGLFFFNRGFMDYHKDRFTDHSLLIFNEKQELSAILPANEKDQTIYSHQGLTFGSLVMSKKIKAVEVLAIFDAIKSYYKEKGFTKIIYKSIPTIFHSYPSEEDIYALYRNNAKLIKREISSVIGIQNKIELSSSKKNQVNKLTKTGFSIKEETDITEFWNLVTLMLNRQHGVNPVHSLEEIQLLRDTLPNNIRLFTLNEENNLLAGILVFIFGDVVHTQYMSNSDEGRKRGALAFINYYLINDIFKDKKYYSFGISTEDGGHYLNEGLIQQKEEMGGRGIVLDTYEIEL